MSRSLKVIVFVVCCCVPLREACSEEPKSRPGPAWAMGPFAKLDKPVLSPTPDSTFDCPIEKTRVRWERQNVYNPAVVVRDGKVYLLYRADDGPKKTAWGRTCRIGLAWSEDGRKFTRYGKPVIYPDNDPWKKYEWEGGCEDVHVVEDEAGTYYVNYTTWTGTMDTMCVATSKDLVHWTKHGPAFARLAPDRVPGSRSGVIVTRQAGERLLPVKINGHYVMYYTHPSALAVSDNLIDWKPLGKSVWGGAGGSHESGAIALWREDGILLMFNAGGWAGVSLPPGSWTLGQALIDRNNLTTVLRQQDRPFLQPELDWEKKGFTDNATVCNGLVHFKGEWLAYYGAADRHIGLAVYRPAKHLPAKTTDSWNHATFRIIE